MAKSNKKPKATVEESEDSVIEGPQPQPGERLYVEPRGNADTDEEADLQEGSDSDDEMTWIDMMNQAFVWIGFVKQDDQEALRSEIAELQDMKGLTERDISDLEKSYAKRPGRTGGIFLDSSVPRSSSL